MKENAGWSDSILDLFLRKMTPQARKELEVLARRAAMETCWGHSLASLRATAVAMAPKLLHLDPSRGSLSRDDWRLVAYCVAVSALHPGGKFLGHTTLKLNSNQRKFFRVSKSDLKRLLQH